ncbi:MAG: hypothetical protein QOJ97_2174 [Solirubrobacteraceae bacterium]|nr:hypothetical protein [Solirubrobacteraceae bacterium]
MPAFLALGLAALLLGGAAVRIASLASPGGLERAVAVAVLGLGLVVGETLALGLVGWSGSQAALLGAAALTWAGARAALPAPDRGLGRELVWAWGRLSRAERVALGAVIGALGALTAWLARHPAFGIDGIYDHSAEVASWVHTGHAGWFVSINEALPFSNYPLTSEVALTWACGLSRSFVPVAPWMTGMLALLLASAWLGARELGAPRGAAALAAAVLALLPVTVTQLNGPNTDLPALALLLACGALCAASRRRPPLLAVALLAGGLAIGIKTTVAPLVVVALAAGAVHHRARLRALARPLALAGAAAVALGGVWYLRNLVVHGSPLWPFWTFSWGDPAPPVFQFGHTLLDAPRATLEARWPVYRADLAGGLVVLAGGLLAPLLAPRRAVVAAAAATAASLLLWARSPFTGLPGVAVLEQTAASTDRYLMPACAAAALALALAARGPGLRALAARALLAGGLGWELVRFGELAFPVRPSLGTLALGAGAGVVVALALRPAVRLVPAPARLGVAGLALAAALAPAADGWLARHARTRQFDAAVAQWFAARPGWQEDRRPVAMEPIVAGPLSGDRLRHPVQLIASRETCAEVAARRRRGWVVVYAISRLSPVPLRAPALRCLAGQAPAYADATVRVFGPLGP